MCSINCAKFTGKYQYQSLFLIKLQAEACNFIKKETLGQVFLCDFCEIFKNTFFTEHLRMTVFVNLILIFLRLRPFPLNLKSPIVETRSARNSQGMSVTSAMEFAFGKFQGLQHNVHSWNSPPVSFSEFFEVLLATLI